MNLLGKIFVVLIFVMSLVFMTMALMVYATHKNWKEEIERQQAGPGQQVGWRKRFEDLRAENERLTEQKAALEKEVIAEKTAKVEALAKLQTALANMSNQLQMASTQLNEKEKTLAENTAALKTQQENLTNATKTVQDLTKTVKDEQLRADDYYKKVLAATDQLQNMLVQLPQFKERAEQLAAQVAKAKLLLAQVGRNIEDPLDQSPPPVTTTVAGVSREGLVEINLGSHDGIRQGHQLDVVREGRFLGRIQIIETGPDKAVGQIMRDYHNQQIREGDTVTSRLRILAARRQ